MAGRIKDSTVEAVHQSADFVAVVEERTSLRKQGARLVGRCPFHEERTPSFCVNAVDKLYHCFGCGKGGDTIEFVRDTQGLDFVDAVEWLADRFGITPEYEDSSPDEDARRSRRKRLLALLDDAATFYERYLWDSPGGLVRARLPRRPRPRRGGLPRVPARARDRRHDARPQGAREGLHAEELRDAG